jgi:hypothetical protein
MEKGLGAASGRRNVRYRQFGRAPFGYPPRLRSGLRQNRAGFLERREKGRIPSWLVPTIKGNPRYAPHIDVAHPPRFGADTVI